MQFKKRAGVALAAMLAAAGLAFSAPSAVADPTPIKPPAVSGKQVTAPVDIRTNPKKAPKEAAKGKTQALKADKSGKPIAPTAGRISAAAGYVANVDLTAPYNYCQQGWVYTPVKNATASTKYVKVELYNGSVTQTYYTSVSANTTAWPYFLGVSGNWYAYLYVWDGSQYAYDEYLGGANNCNVSVTRVTASGYTGYIRFDIKNNGNAYASVNTNELAPYPASGTYTGSQWDSPAPGGGTVYRYMYVGTGQKYGIFNDVYGALYYSPWAWSGTL